MLCTYEVGCEPAHLDFEAYRYGTAPSKPGKALEELCLSSNNHLHELIAPIRTPVHALGIAAEGAVITTKIGERLEALNHRVMLILIISMEHVIR